SSPEMEKVPNSQLSFVFGNTAVIPKTPHNLPEDADPEEFTDHYSSETLCLSRTNLKHVAKSVLGNSTVKYLYLEGNQLCSLPDSMFTSLPCLLWLDLRYNHITSLPAEIGIHRSLQTLLLEGNPISELPPELGQVISLKGLNLRNCPITFPPPEIVCEGLQCILQYLRSAKSQRPVSERKISPVLPEVEKLQLSKLVGSSLEQEDSVDEDELQRFRELKEKMILLDKAELGFIGQGNKNPKSSLRGVTKQKKMTTWDSIIPELPLFDTKQKRKPEEQKEAAMKELEEKQATLAQRRKSQEALHEWRSQAQSMKERKMWLQRKPGRQTKKQEDGEKESGAFAEERSDQSQTSGMPITMSDDARNLDLDFRSAHELERQIHAHIEKMQQRCRNPWGTATEQIAAADRDVEEMRKLQTRLLERRQGRQVENCFTIFTGDTWQSFLDKR
ncbi:leucine-rich repeat-containing protein 27-like, partial [Aulostomus maculatus]